MRSMNIQISRELDPSMVIEGQMGPTLLAVQCKCFVSPPSVGPK